MNALYGLAALGAAVFIGKRSGSLGSSDERHVSIVRSEIPKIRREVERMESTINCKDGFQRITDAESNLRGAFEHLGLRDEGREELKELSRRMDAFKKNFRKRCVR